MSSSRAPLLSSACTAHATPPPRCLLGLSKPLLLEPPPRGQAPLAGCLGQTPGSPAHRLQPSCQVQLKTHPLPSGSPTPQVWPLPVCRHHNVYHGQKSCLRKLDPAHSPLRQSKGCMFSQMHTPLSTASHPVPCLTLSLHTTVTDSLPRLCPHSTTCPRFLPLGEGSVQNLQRQQGL